MNKFKFKKKIIIGSANFSNEYGVAKKKINDVEKDKIIKLAISNNLYTIDTAEEYFRNNKIFKNIDKRFKFMTKLKLNKKWTSLDFCKKKIRSHLKKFNNNEVHTFLIHDIKILYSSAGPTIYMNLITLKKQNYFKKIGVSIYNPRCLNYLTNKYDINVVQCPYNLFDKRIINSGWFKKLKEKKIEIHVRSIFLQGLLVDNHLYKNKYFKKWQNIFFKWFKYLIKKNISPVQYCINDLIKYDFDKIIIGINSKDNLKEILNFKVFKKEFKFKDMSTNDLKLIDPRRWKR